MPPKSAAFFFKRLHIFTFFITFTLPKQNFIKCCYEMQQLRENPFVSCGCPAVASRNEKVDSQVQSSVGNWHRLFRFGLFSQQLFMTAKRFLGQARRLPDNSFLPHFLGEHEEAVSKP
jgi:hypothetical protein